MTNTFESKPFSENALRRIAQIIVKKFRYQRDDDNENIYDALFPGRRRICNFFGRAGCLRDFIDSEEVLNSTFLSLAKIQTYPNGRDKLIKIIEQLCDPEEYFEDPGNREVVIAQINEVLSRYNLKVSKNGSVLTSSVMIILDNTADILNNLAVGNAERDEELSPELDRDQQRPLHVQQKVFICYSHKDDKWLRRIQDYLRPLERENVVDLWVDTKIAPGAKWKEEIAKAIKSSTVAVTLVSASFLASDFISEYELPTLLLRAKNEGTTIIPIIVSYCSLNNSGLDVFQAINPPNKPLVAMRRPEWEKTLTSLTETI